MFSVAKQNITFHMISDVKLGIIKKLTKSHLHATKRAKQRRWTREIITVKLVSWSHQTPKSAVWSTCDKVELDVWVRCPWEPDKDIDEWSDKAGRWSTSQLWAQQQYNKTSASHDIIKIMDRDYHDTQHNSFDWYVTGTHISGVSIQLKSMLKFTQKWLGRTLESSGRVQLVRMTGTGWRVELSI